jgi:hypothetical protein
LYLKAPFILEDESGMAMEQAIGFEINFFLIIITHHES